MKKILIVLFVAIVCVFSCNDDPELDRVTPIDTTTNPIDTTVIIIDTTGK